MVASAAAAAAAFCHAAFVTFAKLLSTRNSVSESSRSWTEVAAVASTAAAAA